MEVMLLLPECDWRRLAGSTRVITVGCATDNQGNHHLLDRLMMTGYSLDLILKLSYHLSRRRMALRAEWVSHQKRRVVFCRN